MDSFVTPAPATAVATQNMVSFCLNTGNLNRDYSDYLFIASVGYKQPSK